MEQAVVIDYIAGNRGDDRNKGHWDLPKANRPVPDVGRNKQKVLFCHFSELGRRVG